MDRRLLVLAVGMFALGTDSFVVAGVLPGIAHAFGISIGAAGQMASIYSITFALLSPPIAALAADVPRKRLLLCGGIIFVLANIGTVLAPTFGFALVTRIIAGIGAATFSPTATGAAATLVRPEQRGFALSVVVAGLTISTALGTPIGAVIGGLGDWRWTMGFVAVLGALAVVGVAVFLSEVPLPSKVTLAKRLEPLLDSRVVLTLATTLVALSGIFTVYTYFAVVFEQAIGGNAAVLGSLLVLWGIGGTVSNLFGGRVVDIVGSRRVIVTILVLLAIFSAVLPWLGAQLWIVAPVVCLWGACSWGQLVPQQFRLVALAPTIAPILMGLNSACSYLGMSLGGVFGAVGIRVVGAHSLGLIGAALAILALILAELANSRIFRLTLRAAGNSGRIKDRLGCRPVIRRDFEEDGNPANSGFFKGRTMDRRRLS
jgi:predicted MFS family arabinose efflux permease